MSCSCMDVIDRKLADANKNTRISRTYTLGGSVGIYPTIRTEKINSSVRMKPMTVLPSYCPWCGLHYETGKPSTRASQAGDA